MAWVIDASHSQVEFSVRHMMLSKTRGRFETFSGTVDINEQNPATAKVDVTIDTGSVNTRDPQRDGHLKSPDFFDAATYPTMHFVSTTVEQTGSTTAKLHGELTIRNVTKPVTLDIEFLGKAKSPWGTTNAGFSARAVINREDWGLTWNQNLETGGILVGKEITIEIEAELTEQANALATEDAVVGV